MKVKPKRLHLNPVRRRQEAPRPDRGETKKRFLGVRKSLWAQYGIVTEMMVSARATEYGHVAEAILKAIRETESRLVDYSGYDD